MSETPLVRDIQLLNIPGVRLFRNNVGRLQTKDGRWVQFGLCVGSSDLIGFKSVRITPEMVGRQVAVFCAIECKSGRGTVMDDQMNFLGMVGANGGLVLIARSVDDVSQALNTPPDAGI